MKRKREALSALLVLGILGLAYWLSDADSAPSERPSPSVSSSGPRASVSAPRSSLPSALESPQRAAPPKPAPSSRPAPSREAAFDNTAPGEVFGRVTRAGSPVAGARVQLEVWPRGEGTPFVKELFADAAGRYRCGLPEGSWGEARVSAQLLLAGSIHWGETRARVTRKSLDLVLREWAGISLSAPAKEGIEHTITFWSETHLGWVHLGDRGVDSSGEVRFDSRLEGTLVGVAYLSEPKRSFLFGKARDGVLRVEEIGAAELKVMVRDASGALVPCAISVVAAPGGFPPPGAYPQRLAGWADLPSRAMKLLGQVQAVSARGESTWHVPPGFALEVKALALGAGEEWRVRRAAGEVKLKPGERSALELTLRESPLARLELGGLPPGTEVWAHVPAGVSLRREGQEVLFSGLLDEEQVRVEAVLAAPDEGGPVQTGRLELGAGERKGLRLEASGRLVLEGVAGSKEDYSVVVHLEGARGLLTYRGLETGEFRTEASQVFSWAADWSPAGAGKLAMDLAPGRYHLLGAARERLATFEVEAGGVVRLDCAPFALIPR